MAQQRADAQDHRGVTVKNSRLPCFSGLEQNTVSVLPVRRVLFPIMWSVMKNTKVLSVLGLMSLASTAAVAASGPTLGSLFDASGIQVSGAVAGSFRQDANDALNSFQVDQGLLSISYQPQSGFGAAVDVATGDYNDQAGNVGRPNSGVALSQAYLQYKSGALTVQGGRVYTAAGYEVFPVTGNLFVTRSLAFANESTYHTGLRASYVVSDAIKVSAGVHDGLFDKLDNQASVTKNKAFELGGSWAYSPNLSLSLTGYVGKNAALDKQSLYSFVATYAFSKDLSFALNVDQGQKSASDTDKWNAVAVYATYAVSAKTKVGVRLEDLNAKKETVAFNDAGAWALVASHALTNNLDLRAELSDVDEEGGKDRNVQGAIQAVLKF